MCCGENPGTDGEIVVEKPNMKTKNRIRSWLVVGAIVLLAGVLLIVGGPNLVKSIRSFREAQRLALVPFEVADSDQVADGSYVARLYDTDARRQSRAFSALYTSAGIFTRVTAERVIEWVCSDAFRPEEYAGRFGGMCLHAFYEMEPALIEELIALAADAQEHRPFDEECRMSLARGLAAIDDSYGVVAWQYRARPDELAARLDALFRGRRGSGTPRDNEADG